MRQESDCLDWGLVGHAARLGDIRPIQWTFQVLGILCRDDKNIVMCDFYHPFAHNGRYANHAAW